jgi:hypothetical protein
MNQETKDKVENGIYEKYLDLLEERDYCHELLREALEWIERPVETQDDAALFIYFEDKVKRLIEGGE